MIGVDEPVLRECSSCGEPAVCSVIVGDDLHLSALLNTCRSCGLVLAAALRQRLDASITREVWSRVGYAGTVEALGQSMADSILGPVMDLPGHPD